MPLSVRLAKIALYYPATAAGFRPFIDWHWN